MNEKQYEMCDRLVYIPQYGKGTASLNVSNAAAIILHHFALWAGYEQQSIEEAKFVVEQDAKACGKRSAEGEYHYTKHELEVRAKRQSKRQHTEKTSESSVETIAEVALSPEV